MRYICKDCGAEFESQGRRSYCEPCALKNPQTVRNRKHYEAAKQPHDSSPDRPKLPCSHLTTFLIDGECVACSVMSRDNAWPKRSDPMHGLSDAVD